MSVSLPLAAPVRPWNIAANDNLPAVAPVSVARRSFRRRMLGILTAAFLISGAVLHLVNIHVESVVISHTSRSAMIFGLVGLRRITHEEEKSESGQA